jgi:hypothetical protein
LLQLLLLLKVTPLQLLLLKVMPQPLLAQTIRRTRRSK